MTMFERAFAFVVGHEGGYSDERADPGNWTGGQVGDGELRGTKFGISAASYPAIDIANLTLDDAQAIYQRDYWQKIDADALSPPLALLAFDAAVNNGVARSLRWLQTAKPLGGVAACAEFQAQRLMFMAGLSTWHDFGLGWARRLCRLPYESMTMTGDV